MHSNITHKEHSIYRAHRVQITQFLLYYLLILWVLNTCTYACTCIYEKHAYSVTYWRKPKDFVYGTRWIQIRQYLLYITVYYCILLKIVFLNLNTALYLKGVLYYLGTGITAWRKIDTAFMLYNQSPSGFSVPNFSIPPIYIWLNIMLNTYVCIKHNGFRSDILCCKCIYSYILTTLRCSNLRKQRYFLDFAYFFKVCIKEWSQTHTSPLLLNQPPYCSVISDVGIPNMHMHIIECIKYFMYAYETQWIQIKHYQTMLYKYMSTFKIALLNLKTLTFKLYFVPFENCKAVWSQIITALMLYNQSPDCSMILIEGCRYYKYSRETQLLYYILLCLT